MLRSIGDIARSHGEQLYTPEAQISCMVVFALGSPKMNNDDNNEPAYFAIRGALSRAVQKASVYLTENGIAHEGVPVLIRLINELAMRFEINVTEKIAAQAIPVIGALGGAAINTMFINQFQNIAHGHFIIRRLERKYSSEFVRSEYETC